MSIQTILPFHQPTIWKISWLFLRQSTKRGLFLSALSHHQINIFNHVNSFYPESKALWQGSRFLNTVAHTLISVQTPGMEYLLIFFLASLKKVCVERVERGKRFIKPNLTFNDASEKFEDWAKACQFL